MLEEINIDDLPSEVRTEVQQRLERIEQELDALGAER